MSARFSRRTAVVISLLVILALLLPAGSVPSAAQQKPLAPLVSPAATAPTQAAVSQALRASPVMFIENAGQFVAAAPDAGIAAVLATATQIAAGWYHTCALTTGGGAKCWGFNAYGELGDGTTTTRTAPVDVSGLASGAVAIAAGGYHTCALMDVVHGGGVKCWGNNAAGQLGDGTTTNRYTPTDVSGLASVMTGIVVGGSHTCVLMDAVHGGGVKCWGGNTYGELGDGTTIHRSTPVDVSGLASGVLAIAAGGIHTCALMDAVHGSGAKCWGDNGWGQLGDGTTTDRATPADVSGLASGVLAIAAGWYHTCALMDAVHGGGGKCWGYNYYGQLGDGTTTTGTAPVDVSGLVGGLVAIVAGGEHTCALMDAVQGGGAKCWGDNSYGQLGDGTTTDRHTPVDVVGYGGQVTYSVSGRVTDGDGHSIADVTVSIGEAGSAATDGNGAYTISGLAAGTYTLTPSKSGYTFSPASRTVTVPPDATEQDFVILTSSSGFVIGGFDSVRGGSGASLQYGSYYAQARGSISTNFPGATYKSFSTITSDALDGVDLLFISSVSNNNACINPLTTDEQSALRNYVDHGGCAILLVDNDLFGGSGTDAANESLIDPFGIDVDGTLGSEIVVIADPAGSSITNGPYGTVTSFTQAYPGWLSQLGTYASSLGTNSLGTGLAEIPTGKLQAGSGRVIIYSDGNSFFDSDASGAFPGNENLFLNTIEACLSDRYLISGRVTTGNDGFLSDVIISVSSSYSTVTDANGYYTLTLPAGTYTLTPTKPGYTFSPASRAVTVPPEATVQDFAATRHTTLAASPDSVPADNSATAQISLSDAPAGHRVRLSSSLAGSIFAQLDGMVNSDGQYTTTIHSSAAGTAHITAQDLTTGETFPASASVTFTPVVGDPQPPPSQPGDIVIADVKGDCGQINCPKDGFFMLGLDGLRLPLKATVDWKGQPLGTVEFTINDYTQSVTADAQGARFELDINQRLHEGPNVLSIVAHSSGKTSKPFDLHLDGYRLPQWIMDGVNALPTIGNQALVLEVAFPGQPLCKHKQGRPKEECEEFNFGFLPGDLNHFQWQTNIKMTLPTRGGAFEVEVSRERDRATTGRKPKAFLKLIGHEFDLEYHGRLSGVLGLETPYAVIQELGIGGSISREFNWDVGIAEALNALPPFGPSAYTALSAVPQVRDWLNDRAKLYVKITPEFSGDFTVAFQPAFHVADAQIGLDFPVELGAQADLWVVEGHIYGGLGGKGTFGYSDDDVRIVSVKAYGYGGYKFRLAWFSLQDRGDWKLAEWPFGSGQMALTFASAAMEPLEWGLIGHSSVKDYATFRAQPDKRQAFAHNAVEIEPLGLTATTAITSVLVSNVYTYPEPSLAVQPVSGDALLLWVHDDIAKPVGQAQEIAFSRWDGSTWSVPAGVTDDDRLDGAPQVAWAAGGEGVAVWQRLNETLPITATFDVTTAQKIEIATAVYGPTLGTWSPVSLLTNNAALDMTPHLTANAAGKLLTAWRQNDAGLLSGTVTDTDRIVAAFYDGGWGTAAVAVDGIPGLVDLAAGYGMDAATIAFTRYLTPTGSVTPTLQLFTAAWDGSAWAAPVQRTDDGLGHRSPQVVYNAANEPLVVWLVGTGQGATGQGQALSLRNLATAAVVTLTLPAEIGAIDEFRVVQDAAGNLAAVFTSQAGQRDLFVAFFDQAHGVWGNPVRLTDDRASEAYPAPGLDPTGRLLLGYAATAITPITHTTTMPETGEVVTYTLPTEGQTDLLTLSHAFVRNLTLADTDLVVSDDHPAPGATVVLSATVHNTGDLALDGVAVNFYDGDPDAGGTLIATQVWPAALAAGFTATLTTTYTVPETGSVRDLYAAADPANAIAESSEADNTAHLAAFGPDLELAAAGAEPWGGSDVGLVTVIHNLGTTGSPTTTVAFYADDLELKFKADTGSLLKQTDTSAAQSASADFQFQPANSFAGLVVTDTLPALAAGATFTLTTPWNYGVLPEGSYALTATANPGGASFTEVVTANNTSSLALPVRPDLSVNPLYVWAVPLPDGTMVVTAAVSNFGSVAAPAATVEIYVDAVFSDTARLRTLTLPAIAPASQVYVTATWGSPMAGEHTFYVLVNADRSVAELTWANNVASAWAAGPLTDLAAAKESGGARLTWTHGGRSVARYEVYRSTNPYFTPGGADSQKLNDVPPPAAGNTVSYTDAGAFGSPTGAYFYVVVTVDRAGLVYPASNRVGAFSFGLTPGAP